MTDAEEGPRPGGPARPVAARVAAAVVAGTAVAALVLVARGAGLLTGTVALAVAVIGVLALPTSRSLSRRVVLAACAVLGWLPFAWWLPLPAGTDRSAALLAVLYGALVAWVVAGARPRERAAFLLPRLRGVDTLPLVAGLVAAWVVRPWSAVGSGRSALAVLLRGWDHSAHYDIVRMLRDNGVPTWAVGPPPLGDTWSYQSYPQGFHAVAAGLMELLAGATPGSVGDELVLYSHTLAILAIVSTTAVAGGVAALPFLQRRLPVAVPAVTFAVGGFLLGPTGWVLHDGFPNFALATVLTACLVLVVPSFQRGVSPVQLVAVGGALVGIAHGWLLLLSMALPALLVLAVPWRRGPAVPPRGERLLGIAVGVATAAGVGSAASMVAGESVGEVLVIEGAVTPMPRFLLVGPTVLTVLVVIAAVHLARRCGVRVVDRRIVAMAVVPAVGVGCAVLIAVVQLQAGGELGYYFRKYTTALAFVSIVVVALLGAWAAARWPGRPSRRAAWAAAAAATVTASQAFGLTVPGDGLLISPALQMRADVAAEAAGAPDVVDEVLAAAEALAPRGGRHVYLVGPGVDAPSAGQWYNAMSGRWTNESNELMRLLFAPQDTMPERAFVVRGVLEADPDNLVVVRPVELAELTELVGPELAGRVVSW